MLPWELEDWLTAEGDRVVRGTAEDESTRSMVDQAIYELWLLDTETRNGGLSQYFYNHSLKQWEACQQSVRNLGLTTFAPFASAVNEIVEIAAEPGATIQQRGQTAEDLWQSHQLGVVAELRARVLEA
jgi:hypothetical protein